MSAPRGRCAHEENARAFHQGPDTVDVHREAGYIDAALFSMVYHVTPVVVSKAGSIYHFVLNSTSLQLIPASRHAFFMMLEWIGLSWDENKQDGRISGHDGHDFGHIGRMGGRGRPRIFIGSGLGLDEKKFLPAT